MAAIPLCCKYHPNAYVIEDCSDGHPTCTECGLVVSDEMFYIEEQFINEQVYTSVLHSLDGTFENHESNVIKAYRMIQKIAEIIALEPKTIDQIDEFYGRIYDEEIVNSRNTEVIAVSCLAIICKQEDIEWTLNEICEIAEISTKQVTKHVDWIFENHM